MVISGLEFITSVLEQNGPWGGGGIPMFGINLIKTEYLPDKKAQQWLKEYMQTQTELNCQAQYFDEISASGGC